MKKISLLILCSLCSYFINAQINGISYQAVIIDNNPQEIPGVDIPSNNLSNVPLDVQFSIIDYTNTLEYQEIHTTTTDPYGMINLMIGQGVSLHGLFDEIYWDQSKFLSVEIDLKDGNGLVPFSYQELTYIPYVRHREIIATSTLDVDGETNINNSFTVNNSAPTLLTGDLTVEGLVSFDGELAVGGDTQLYADLTVEGNTIMNGDLEVNGDANFADGFFENITVTQQSNLNLLDVNGKANFNDSLKVNNMAATKLSGTLLVERRSDFKGQVKIEAQGPTSTIDNYQSYPLQVEGSQQGIAIKVSPASPNRNNNYISFWDGDNTIRGRVEANEGLVTITTDIIWDLISIPDFDDVIDADPGDTPPDVAPNQYFNNNYAFGAYSLTLELVAHILRFGINVTGALGLCVTGDCDDVVWSFLDVVVAGIQLGGYITYNEINIGVAYESGGADYAEWLKKANVDEVFSFGDVVGVKGGLISKSFTNANKFMVISQNPMISAAMPEEGEENQYDKVAFIGQVPVKVIGKAAIGDYILASGNGDGHAIAVSPDNMKIKDYNRIVGVAWSNAENKLLFNYVQTAIGINTNDLVHQVEKMQGLMNKMQSSLAKIDPEFEADFFDVKEVTQTNKQTKSYTLKERVANKSKALEYSSLSEALSQIDKYMQKNTSNFDVMELPYMKEIVENPTRENAEKLIAYYSKVLEKIEKMQPIKQN